MTVTVKTCPNCGTSVQGNKCATDTCQACGEQMVAYKEIDI